VATEPHTGSPLTFAKKHMNVIGIKSEKPWPELPEDATDAQHSGTDVERSTTPPGSYSAGEHGSGGGSAGDRR
jgi:hypothetical protein